MKHKDLYDFSNYPKTHMLYDDSNKAKPGYFSDECPADPIIEYIGLRSKLYTFYTKNSNEKRIANGIHKSSIDHDLRHEMYYQCLFGSEKFICDMNLIQSQNHNLRVINVNKIALSPADDKRWLLKNTTDTLAHGHFLTHKAMSKDL